MRKYQQEALDRVIEGFQHNERGKLIMACGTGKTFTSLKIAEKQTNNSGFVLFLVPSLALLSQTLLEWKRQASAPQMAAFAVCSDSKVGKSGDGNDFSSYMRPNELKFPATTDAKSLASAVNESLLQAPHAHSGMTVVFATYQSLDVIHQAQTEFELPAFDLIICDEAHRTAGAYLLSEGFSIKKYSAAQAKRDAKAKSMLSGLDVPSISESDDAEAANDAGSAKTNQDQTRRGAVSKVDDESLFTRIHDSEYVKGAKRLYMTATPKIYGSNALDQENNGEAVLYSMDKEEIFGPVFFRFTFDQAVQAGCLVDFKLIVLTIDKSLVGEASSHEKLMEFSKKNVAKVIGTWKALNKYGFSEDDDGQPMRRAVGFAQIIDSGEKYDKAGSKQFTKYFQQSIAEYRAHLANVRDEQGKATSELAFFNDHHLVCDCAHIDGSMNALEKGQLLDWLRSDPDDGHCKILFNVRCLSEGVDVPALDAVIFLSPRKSQVEAVQTVGRVMRIAPGKKRGYVIIPVVIDDSKDPEKFFEDKDTGFRVVWHVLNALRSINPDLVLVDGATGKLDSRIDIVCTHNDAIALRSESIGSKHPTGKSKNDQESSQGSLGILEGHDQSLEAKIKAQIVKKVGNRREWQDWAEDVAKICTEQVNAINQTLSANSDPVIKADFAKFCLDLNDSIGQHLDRDEIIEMLAQHIVVKPILDELFRGFPFTEQNPIAKVLSDMLDKLDAEGLTKTNNELRAFYRSVGFRMRNVTSLAERQKVIVDLFDRFFKVAFPKLQEKLGIVYTPLEVVDFINHSVNDILKHEFGSSLGSSDVHIVDPFTGTGTFITRMMQSQDLIAPHELEHKYRHELHAQEILPLAYYVASINIESVYHELRGKDAQHYERNSIVVLTDTFIEVEDKAHPIVGALGENAALRDAVRKLPIKVIVGNPPYSVGQASANDDNQNESYPALEQRIAETYVSSGTNGNKKSLYDSYIKAFRWASDRIGEQGVIAFVSNAGWIDSAAANGMRRSLQQEFSSVYVYHLKGNQRTSGEQSRKEGGKIFGSGSRAPIAVTILVKNPQASEQGKIYFAAVDDYLSRDEKLGRLKELGSIINAPLVEIKPDAHGDWLNQRRDDFAHFITIDGKKTDGVAIFDNYSCGITTNRDAWSYNSSKQTIEHNLTGCIEFYNFHVESFKRDPISFVRDNDTTKIKWSFNIDNLLKKGVVAYFSNGFIVKSLYRPFCKQFLYNDKAWIEGTYQMPKLFPFNGAENLVIGTASDSSSFSCLMSSNISDYHVLESATQYFPRYLYRKVGAADKAKGGLMAGLEDEAETAQGVVINGYERVDAIRTAAVEHFRAAYPAEADGIDADAVFYYIYGILHSPDYRATYANNLIKELPRIPRVATFADFKAFEEAGRALAQLHVGYEKVKPYEGCTFSFAKNISFNTMDYRVTQLKYGKIKGKTGNAAKDKSVIVYNNQLTLHNIPLEVQEYVVNKKSALDWVVERCGVSVDKASRIVNDFNDYAQEVGDERYILNLILRVITVSLETMKIVKALPKLQIHKLDQ